MDKKPVNTSLGDKFNLSMLIYGSPGAGKTSFIGSYNGWVHFYNFDPQGTSVLRHGVTSQLTEDPFTDSIYGPGKTYEAFWKQMQQDEKDGLFRELYENEGVLAIDSYTTCEHFLVEYVATKVLNKPRKMGGALEINRQDWPTISSYVLAFFKAISRLPCAVVVVCHEKSIQDGDNNVFWRPTILGQQAEAAPKWFTEYAHVSLNPNQGQKLRVQGNPHHPASSRLFDRKKKVLLNPTVNTFYKAFHGQELDCKIE